MNKADRDKLSVLSNRLRTIENRLDCHMNSLDRLRKSNKRHRKEIEELKRRTALCVLCGRPAQQDHFRIIMVDGEARSMPWCGMCGVVEDTVEIKGQEPEKDND